MATYFSDAMAQPVLGTAGGNWSPTTNPTSYNATYKRPAYHAHARLRKKKMGFFPQAFSSASSDQIVLGTFKSSDRLWDLTYVQNGTLSAGAFSLGFFAAQQDHVPVTNAALSQAALLATAFSVTAAQTRSDFLTGLGANGQYRGLTVWQMLDLGTPAFTKDPMLDYDLVMTITTTWATVAPTICFFEATFVSLG
jgi:hypothetical protein